MPPDAVAEARDLAASLSEALGLGAILGGALLEAGLEDTLTRLRVPNMDAFLVVRREAAKIKFLMRSIRSR